MRDLRLLRTRPFEVATHLAEGVDVAETNCHIQVECVLLEASGLHRDVATPHLALTELQSSALRLSPDGTHLLGLPREVVLLDLVDFGVGLENPPLHLLVVLVRRHFT